MKSDTAQRHSAGVFRALDHVLVNSDNSAATIQKLSKVARFAPFHFHRVFRSVTGVSVQRYIRRLRLDYSINQLLFTDGTILNIALQAGYQSHEAFTRAFQQSVGVSPSALRVAFAAGSQPGTSSERVSAANSSAIACRLYPVSVQRRPLTKAKVIFRSHFGPYVDVPECWKQLSAQAVSFGLNPSQLRAVGIMHDHPLRCERVRYDACFVVGPEFGGSSEFAMQVLPDPPCAVTPHFGPYSLTPYTYIRLVNQCAIQGTNSIVPLPYYEVYQEGPPTVSQDARADLFVPLARKIRIEQPRTPGVR